MSPSQQPLQFKMQAYVNYTWCRQNTARRDQLQKTGLVTLKPCYCCGATPSHPKKECLARDAECYNCGKKGHFQGSCRLKKEEKEVGKQKTKKKKKRN